MNKLSVMVIILALSTSCFADDCCAGTDNNNSWPITNQNNGPASVWEDGRLVQVISAAGNNRTAEGSGAFIDVDGYTGNIVTCEHGLGNLNDTVSIRTADGIEHPGTVVATDRQADIAIVQLNKGLQGLYSFRLASVEPPVGSRAVIRGFGGGNMKYHANNLIVSEYGPIKSTARGFCDVGDSGGPVTDQYDGLLGPLSGNPGGPAIYGRLTRLRELLAGLSDRQVEVDVETDDSGLVSVDELEFPVPQPSLDSDQSIQASENPPDIREPLGVDSGKLDELSKAIEELRESKQDKGNYLTKDDLSGLVKNDEFSKLTENTQEITEILKDTPSGEEFFDLQEKVEKGHNILKEKYEEVKVGVAEQAKSKINELIEKNKETIIGLAVDKAKQVGAGVLPGVATVLGGTGVGLGVTALVWLWRVAKRVKGGKSGNDKTPTQDVSDEKGGGAKEPAASFRETEGAGGTSGTTSVGLLQPIERDLSEGRELLQLFQLEGRDPLQDAVAGRIVRNRLDEIADSISGSPELKKWANDLRIEIDKRFNEVAPTKFTVSDG